MNTPKVSIIVPCYNQAQYLDEALQSVFDQTYSNWECIIVNDGSPDNTEEVAKTWLEKDSRFKYFFKENGGLSSARNAGIEISKGEYILPLDADDKISNNYLELAFSKISNNKNIKVVYCDAEYFGAKYAVLKLKPFSLENLAKKNMIFCTALFRKDDWEQVNGYDLNMVYGYEDWEFWINILKNGGDVFKLNETCFYYRIKENSMLLSLNQNKKRYLYDYLSFKHTDFLIKYLGNFFELSDLENTKKLSHLENLLKSKKHAINILSKAYLNFKIFKI